MTARCKIENCTNEVFKERLCEEHYAGGKSTDSLSVDLNFILHSFLLMAGRWLKKLLTYYDNLFSLNNDDVVTIHKNLATHYRKKGNLNKAIESVKKVVDADPQAQKGKLQLTLGELYALNNNYDEARVTFKGYLKKHPDSPEAKMGLANIFSRENDFENAIKLYEETLPKNNNNHDLLFRLGVLYDKKKDHKKAVEHIRSALTLAPDEIKYHQHLGFIFESMGSHDEAVPHFKKVLEIESERAALTEDR